MEPGSSSYIDLLKKSLCDYHRSNRSEFKPLYPDPRLGIKILRLIDRILRAKSYVVCRLNENSEEMRMNGTDRPVYADTMIGMKRLNNIEYCVNEVVKNNVEGDLIELGVWRG